VSDELEEVSVFSTCSTFVIPWVWRVSTLRTVRASVVSALTLLINEPVTTISCNSGAALSDDAGPAVAEAVVPVDAAVPAVAVVATAANAMSVRHANLSLFIMVIRSLES
jgi:hypothetical protein